MVSVNTNINNGYNANLTNNPQPQQAAPKTSVNYADIIASSANEKIKKMQEGSGFQKKYGAPSAVIPILLALPFDLLLSKG